MYRAMLARPCDGRARRSPELSRRSRQARRSSKSKVLKSSLRPLFRWIGSFTRGAVFFEEPGPTTSRSIARTIRSFIVDPRKAAVALVLRKRVSGISMVVRIKLSPPLHLCRELCRVEYQQRPVGFVTARKGRLQSTTTVEDFECVFILALFSAVLTAV